MASLPEEYQESYSVISGPVKTEPVNRFVRFYRWQKNPFLSQRVNV
jgi:hypothetical protein